MADSIYTLGMWKVKPGQGGAFVREWKALADIFKRLPDPPCGTGFLVQSINDSGLYYSFGPWRSLQDVQAMRNDQSAQEGIRKLLQQCIEGTPGAFKVVAEAPV